MSTTDSGSPPRQRSSTARVVDVARDAGVSPGTVSNVYNRPEVVRAELRVRVLESAARLGFAGADPTARSLRSGRTHAIGIVIRERLGYAFEDLAAVRLLQGISDAADLHQLSLMILPAPPEEGTSTDPGVRRAAVDGLLLYSLAGDDPLIRSARQRRLPAVVVDAPFPPPDGIGYVGVDDHAIGSTAAGHLLGLGHRRIGVLSLRLAARDRPGLADHQAQARATSYVARSRLAGAAAAVGAAGLDWNAVPVVQCQLSTPAQGRLAMRTLLDHAPDLTAVLALSDSLALGGRDEAQARGLSVPGDLSMIGIDDSAPRAERLTTVRQPHRDKGRVAAELLVRAMAGAAGPVSPRLFPTELVVRGSTSSPV